MVTDASQVPSSRLAGAPAPMTAREDVRVCGWKRKPPGMAKTRLNHQKTLNCIDIKDPFNIMRS